MSNKVIATAGIITVGVGSANAIANHKTLPSTRFLLGSGVLFLILSVMADSGLDELAKALSIAVMTTVILGEGNGVLSWINQKGEVDTQRSANVKRRENAAGVTTNKSVNVYGTHGASAGPDTVSPFPGIWATP